MNPWNSILSGLYQGGTALASGLVERSEKNKPKARFEEESAYLKDIFKNSINSATGIVNDTTDVTKGPVSPVPEQTLKPDINITDLYQRKAQALADLSGMKYGGPYANALNNLYQDVLGNTEWDIKEGKDGEFYAFNKKNLTYKKLTDAPKKETPFSTKDWEIFLDDQGVPFWGERVMKDGKVQIDFRDKLNQEELNNYNLGKQKDALSLERGTGTRRRTGSSSRKNASENYSEFDKNLINDLTAFAEMKADSVATGDSYWKTTDQYGDTKESDNSKKYNTLFKKLQNALPGEDIDALANEVYKGDFKRKTKTSDASEYVQERQKTAKYRSDLRAFQKDVEDNQYSYIDSTGKKVGNYNISPDDWIKELDESGYLDFENEDQWNELAKWFQDKTGRDINNYVNKPKF